MSTECALDFPEANRGSHGSRLSLLGSWRLSCNDAGPVPSSAQRLLALLALRGRQTRVHVAATLWPDIDDERASGRLRSLLCRLRKVGADIYELAHGSISLGHGAQVDVHELTRVASMLVDGTGSPAGRMDLDLDSALLVLDGPDLLVGWYDDWVLVERDRLNDLRVHALEALVDRFIEAGRPREALRAARVAVRIDPYRESAHRAAIRALVAEGNPAAAVRQYERYRSLVRAELGVNQLTQQMVAAIAAIVDS